MKKVFSIVLFCCFTIVCQAQEILIPQPPAKYITRFPFKQYSGGVMVIRATFADIKDSFNFILDTGSGGISLDSSTCAAYHLVPTPSDTTIKGMGGEHKVSFMFNQQMHLPGLTVKGLNFHVNDYDILTSVYGEKIDGIVGYSFFSKYIVKINFDSLNIEVYAPGEINYPKGGTLLRPTFTKIPIQNLTINDRKKINFKFYFDTGAGLCFLLNEQFASDSTIFLPRRKKFLTQAEGMGGRLQMSISVLKMVQIGHYKFRNVPTYIYDDDFNVTSYPFVGGLLGNDLLRRFNLVINYRKREIHLTPNGHFKDPFDYAYTGLAIYNIDGIIVVEDVIPGSPADKAGLIKEDIILGIDKNFTNNIMEYKNLLQTMNTRMKVTVRRNKELLQFSIRPISIL